MKKVEEVRITGIDAIPEVQKKEFRFLQAGKDYVLEFIPLTAEQVEAIRASLPAPVPPLKPLKGFTAKEMAFRKSQALPLVGPDTDDPDYRAAEKVYEREVTLEMVRTSLGWDVPRDQFAQALRTKLPQGVYNRLITDITAATFQLDGNLVESFLGNLVRRTEQDEASTTSTESTAQEKDG